MICSGCRHALLARALSTQSSSPIFTNVQVQALKQSNPTGTAVRTVATVPSTKNAAPSTPPPSTASSGAAPAATSSSTPSQSQPYSEPFFPSTTSAHTPPQAPSSPSPSPSAPLKVTSSVTAGTAFSSLTYTKPTNTSKLLIALEDHEYPSWLWTLVPDPNNPSSSETSGGVDVASMTKRARAKYERKQAKLLAGMEKPIPLHEQSKDLTGPEDDAVVSTNRRRELTRSMREARRKGIREANFLRSM